MSGRPDVTAATNQAVALAEAETGPAGRGAAGPGHVYPDHRERQRMAEELDRAARELARRVEQGLLRPRWQNSWPVLPPLWFLAHDCSKSAAAQEAAEAAFRRALADGTIAASTFTTELFCRCRDAVIGTRTGSATALDVAILSGRSCGADRDATAPSCGC